MKKIIVTENQFDEIINAEGGKPLLNEVYPHTRNRGKLIPITETNAKRLIDRHTQNGYAIISACRGECSNKENINRTKEMINIIRNSGFSYTLSYGGFIENNDTDDARSVYERSCIIYAERKNGEVDSMGMYNLAVELCNRYNQDSVLVKMPNDVPKYIKQDGSVDMEFSGDMTFNDITQQYFTDLHKNTTEKIKPNLRPTRFTFLESYIAPKPQCYSESHTRYLKGEIFLNS